MPMCTYLGDTEHTAPTGHREIDELLPRVRKLTGRDWRVGVRAFTERRWFRADRVSRIFSLYFGLQWGEFQVINFYRDESGTTINPGASAELVAAYLYGMLGVLEHPEERPGAGTCVECGQKVQP